MKNKTSVDIHPGHFPSLPLNLDQNPTYPIVYGLFSYSGLLTCFAFPAVDGIIMAYCKYLAAQFDIISNQLRTHFDAVIGKVLLITAVSRKFSIKRHALIFLLSG